MILLRESTTTLTCYDGPDHDELDGVENTCVQQVRMLVQHVTLCLDPRGLRIDPILSSFTNHLLPVIDVP